MRTALFCGSFNPFHKGHEDVVLQFRNLFDRFIIVQCSNGGKSVPVDLSSQIDYLKFKKDFGNGRIFHYTYTNTLITNIIKDHKPDAIIRGLRNTIDLEYEKSLKYNYEDLDIHIPILYAITSRELCHVSSSSIREINKLKE